MTKLKWVLLTIGIAGWIMSFGSGLLKPSSVLRVEAKNQSVSQMELPTPGRNQILVVDQYGNRVSGVRFMYSYGGLYVRHVVTPATNEFGITTMYAENRTHATGYQTISVYSRLIPNNYMESSGQSKYWMWVVSDTYNRSASIYYIYPNASAQRPADSKALLTTDGAFQVMNSGTDSYLKYRIFKRNSILLDGQLTPSSRILQGKTIPNAFIHFIGINDLPEGAFKNNNPWDPKPNGYHVRADNQGNFSYALPKDVILNTGESVSASIYTDNNYYSNSISVDDDPSTVSIRDPITGKLLEKNTVDPKILHLSKIPANFTFGKVAHTMNLLQIPLSKPEIPFLQVDDQRSLFSPWQLNVSASVFTNQTGQAIDDAWIKFKQTRQHSWNEQTDKWTEVSMDKTQKLKMDGQESLVISQKKQASSDKSTQTYWQSDQIELDVPGSEVTNESYASKLTWTLVTAPTA